MWLSGRPEPIALERVVEPGGRAAYTVLVRFAG